MIHTRAADPSTLPVSVFLSELLSTSAAVSEEDPPLMFIQMWDAPDLNRAEANSRRKGDDTEMWPRPWFPVNASFTEI